MVVAVRAVDDWISQHFAGSPLGDRRLSKDC